MIEIRIERDTVWVAPLQIVSMIIVPDSSGGKVKLTLTDGSSFLSTEHPNDLSVKIREAIAGMFAMQAVTTR